MPPQFQSKFIPDNNVPTPKPPTPENNFIPPKSSHGHAFLITLTILLIFTGIFGVWYFSNPLPEEETDGSTSLTTSWKTYKNEKYGFEFKYPTIWKVYDSDPYRGIQLQVIEGDQISGVVGDIVVVSKFGSRSSLYASYEKMFSSDTQCPVVAGIKDLSDTKNVYCLTSKKIQVNDGVWKGVVECSASAWYGLKEDPESCPHQFWINTKDYFYIFNFNFFEPIKDNREATVFFDKLLSSFKFISTSTPKIIGGDKDAGGCLIGAGYSWCEAKNKCLRVWEEKCQ